MDDAASLPVDGFVDYCRTQAGLLAGTAETLREEADALLDEVDEGTADLRARLEAVGDAAAGPAGPASTETPGDDTDLDAIEALEADLEAKQSLVAAKQARMDAYRGLAADYEALADELAAGVEDGRAALERVVELEADADAPAYFDDRRTVLEAVAESSDDDPSGGTDGQ